MPLENEDIDVAKDAEQEAAAENAEEQAQEAAGEPAEAATEAVEEGEVQEAEEKSPEAEIEALNAKLAENAERMKRLQADFENFRRRTRQEKEELSNMVIQGFITELLPLVDNFDRAMAAEATDAEKFQQGVEMIYNQLTEILKNKGMEVIDVTDAKFDPNFHQAVMRVQNPDLEDDTIAAEFQKGYMVKGKVIRPSMVQVVTN